MISFSSIFFLIVLFRELHLPQVIHASSDPECLFFDKSDPLYGTHLPLDCRYGSICMKGSKDYNDLPTSMLEVMDRIPNFKQTSYDGMYCECNESHLTVTGLNCDIMYEVCPDNSVCLHGAPCVQNAEDPSNYICDCPKSSNNVKFGGNSCEYGVTDWCRMDSGYDVSNSGAWFCSNGACHDGILDPTEKCICQEGYYGLHCEFKEEKSCSLECFNDGVCKNGAKDYSHMSSSLQEFLPSQDSETNQLYDTHCLCREGYTGRTCETEITKCGVDHCLNGAECQNESCDCAILEKEDTDGKVVKFTGNSCIKEERITCPAPEGFNPEDFYCINGGKCPDNAHEPCDCSGSEYSGPRCEFIFENAKECDLECNNGTCFFGELSMNPFDNFAGGDNSEMHCKCPEGYAGDHCETTIVVCGTNERHCFNGGECVKENDLWTCDCTSNFTAVSKDAGKSCQYEAATYCADPGDSKHSFCTNNGECKSVIEEGGHPGCDCFNGFSGNFCEKTIDESTISCPGLKGFNPNDFFCTNGGQCPENPYEPCDCGSEYSGPRCEFPVESPKECDLECNNGTCFFGGISYSPYDNISDLKVEAEDKTEEMHCKCPQGYAGDHCETEIVLCGEREHHCLNGGECVQDNDQYTCDCAVSWSTQTSHAGKSCQYEATSYCEGPGEGKHSFCTNNGVCKSTILSSGAHPGCECVNGFFGDFCEKSSSKNVLGIASKVFLGFILSLFAVLTIFFSVSYARRGSYKKTRGHVRFPVEIPQEVHVRPRNLDEEHERHFSETLDDDNDNDEETMQNVEII